MYIQPASCRAWLGWVGLGCHNIERAASTVTGEGLVLSPKFLRAGRDLSLACPRLDYCAANTGWRLRLN